MMAEQGRYDRDYARGSYYEDDRGGRGDRDRGRETGDGRRSDALFGSGWSEREERGWGSSGVRDRSGERESGRGSSGGSWFGRGGDRDDHDRSSSHASSASSSARDRDEGRRSSRSGSWFGGSSTERDHRGRERNWEPVEVPARDHVRGRSEDDGPDRDRLERERLERERMETQRLERERRERDDLDRDRMGREPADRERLDRERMDRERLDRERGEREAPESDRMGRGRAAGAMGAGMAARDRGYGPDDHRSGMPIDETGRLIASNKVEGTAVYGLDGERLGSIYNFMVEKHSGQVEYAVMTYGGFLGMGTRYYPLPWQLLKYDTRRGGYRIDLTSRDLERAPSFDRSNEPEFDRSYGDRVHSWYGLNR